MIVRQGDNVSARIASYIVSLLLYRLLRRQKVIMSKENRRWHVFLEGVKSQPLSPLHALSSMTLLAPGTTSSMLVVVTIHNQP